MALLELLVLGVPSSKIPFPLLIRIWLTVIILLFKSISPHCKVAEIDNHLGIAWSCSVNGEFSVDKRSYLNGLVDISGFTSIYNGMNVS